MSSSVVANVEAIITPSAPVVCTAHRQRLGVPKRHLGMLFLHWALTVVTIPAAPIVDPMGLHYSSQQFPTTHQHCLTTVTLRQPPPLTFRSRLVVHCIPMHKDCTEILARRLAIGKVRQTFVHTGLICNSVNHNPRTCLDQESEQTGSIN